VVVVTVVVTAAVVVVRVAGRRVEWGPCVRHTGRRVAARCRWVAAAAGSGSGGGGGGSFACSSVQQWWRW